MLFGNNNNSNSNQKPQQQQPAQKEQSINLVRTAVEDFSIVRNLKESAKK